MEQQPKEESEKKETIEIKVEPVKEEGEIKANMDPDVEMKSEENTQADTGTSNQTGTKRPASWDAKPLSRNQQRKKRKIEQEKKDTSKILCQYIAKGQECFKGENCNFSHDIAQFLACKPPDCGDTCYLYETFGCCKFGFNCRFGSSHIDPVGLKLLTKPELIEKTKNDKQFTNGISQKASGDLKRRKVKFVKSEIFFKELGSKRQKEKLQKKQDEINQKVKNDEKEAKRLEKEERKQIIANIIETEEKKGIFRKPEEGEIAEEDDDDNDDNEINTETNQEYIETPLKAEEITKLNWNNKTYLAPLTTVGNLPFRRVCKEFGVDITCGEMAMALNLLQGQGSEWSLTKRHASEDIFGVQLCSGNTNHLTNIVEYLSKEENEFNLDFIDLNVGCPIDLVVHRGAGSALLERNSKLEELVMDVSDPIAHKLIPLIKSWKVDAVTLHGRSRKQRYSKLADWDYIRKCKDSITGNLPFFGNGDIYHWKQVEDIYQNIGNENLGGVMVARGALIKPWIFTEIKEKRDWDISSGERFDIMKKYVNYGLEHWGSDNAGVSRTRSFLLNWMSFSHRYYPVGMLETATEGSITNKVPEGFQGRDELETLLGSNSVKDWVTISERLLGPVPVGYEFIPKHKSGIQG